MPKKQKTAESSRRLTIEKLQQIINEYVEGKKMLEALLESDLIVLKEGDTAEKLAREFSTFFPTERQVLDRILDEIVER